MKQRKITLVGLLFCAVAGRVIGELLFQKPDDVTSFIDGDLGLPSPTAEEETLLVCDDTRFDELYLAAVHCDQSYVVCQSGSVVYAGLCPPGTRFHVDRRTCLDEDICLGDQRSADRDPRQIKFSLEDDAFENNDAWNSGGVAGKRIEFKSLELLDSYPPSYDGVLEGLVRRQIKFRSLPEEFSSESAIPDDPPTPYDDSRRRPRQIKFRSLAERADEPKKHEDRRQVKFDALSNSDDQPLMTYGTDPLNALYSRRRS